MFALGRANPKDYQGKRKRKDRFSGAHMKSTNDDDFVRLLSASDEEKDLLEYGKIDDDDLEINYKPLKYEITYSPNSTNAIFPDVYTTQPKKHFANITFKVDDQIQDATTDELKLLSEKDFFSKNSQACTSKNALRASGNRCIIYSQVSKVCVMVDWVPVKEETKIEADTTKNDNSTAQVANDTSSTNSTGNSTRRLNDLSYAW